MTGYLHSSYARSLQEFGTVRHLQRSGGWLLEREIPHSGYRDAVACYPLLCCRDWSELGRDLENLDELVSVTAVTDPFGRYQEPDLRASFVDMVRPFKQHFVADLALSPSQFVRSNHRRNAQWALRCLDVAACEEPSQWLDDWASLYAKLVVRHHITGIQVFSKAAFAAQLQAPGMVAFRAAHEGDTVGMSLWFTQNGVAYYHLSALDALGYQSRAGFGLMWFALEYFADLGLQWLSLGAGAGVSSAGTDGLSQFKRGWSTGTRIAYLCGRILDSTAYAKLTVGADRAATDFFPAYRANDFTTDE